MDHKIMLFLGLDLLLFVYNSTKGGSHGFEPSLEFRKDTTVRER
mgnify:CR=1 FL=1